MKTPLKYSLLIAAAGFAQITLSFGAAVIHEPFDMTAARLKDQAGGTGLTGNWDRTVGSDTNEFTVASPGLSYGSLATAGNRVINSSTGGQRRNSISIGTTLSGAGLLTDGATLWFSILVKPVTGSNTMAIFGLADRDGIYPYNNGSNINGVGINLNGGDDLQYRTWNRNDPDPGTLTQTLAFANLPLNETYLVAGKLVWGIGGGDDTFELYLPDTNLNKGAVLVDTQTINVDQTTFDRISLYNIGGGIEFDEIRFGATYADVTPVPEPSSTALLGLGGLALILRRRR